MKIIVVTLAVCICLAIGSNAAGVPTVINYQGRLTDSLGKVLHGEYNIQFTIYDESGTGFWQEQHLNLNGTGIFVDSGLFSVLLGSIEPIADSVFDDQERWLGIKIGSDPELSPRTKLTSVAYAFHASKSDSASVAAQATNAVHADSADFASSVADNAIDSAKIQNGSIQFSDIGQNGASLGQIMKWDGDSWVAGPDEAGTGGGWVDDGNVVRLVTDSDSVGVGTSFPTVKLEVSGDALVTGKATIGPGHTNTGTNAFVAGKNNTSSNISATVSGGEGNSATAIYATVAGGLNATASGNYATVGGGSGNRSSGLVSTIAGGNFNQVAGDFSAILGGWADTITATADYSYLFGIDSKLSEDSTFMVDMPHVRFGDEATGYEFPDADGAAGQVLTTDGVGQVNWSAPAGGAGIVPVGSVIAWLKSLTGTPGLPADSSFVECNGQVVNDAGSPLNGITMPNLNGQNRFLRGSASSGTPGGSVSHAHGTTTLTTGDQNTPAYTAPAAHLPPYYEVVWIMRIK